MTDFLTLAATHGGSIPTPLVILLVVAGVGLGKEGGHTKSIVGDDVGVGVGKSIDQPVQA